MMSSMTDWKNDFGLIELRCLTLSDVESHRKIADGTYLRLTREVAINREEYRALPRWQQHTALAAAHGLTADRAVVSGIAAARLWGISVRSLDPVVDLTLRRSKARSPKKWPRGVRMHSAVLNDDQVIEVGGLRLTTRGRTIADIARWEGLIDGVIATDSVRRLFPGHPFSDLRAKALGPGPYHGRETVRRALDLSRPSIDSPLESWARILLIEAGIGAHIVSQAEIPGPGNSFFRVDLLIDGWLIIEIDGAVKYDGTTFGKTPHEVVVREREREKFLQNRGYVFLRVGLRDLLADEGEDCSLVVQARSLMAARALDRPA